MMARQPRSIAVQMVLRLSVLGFFFTSCVDTGQSEISIPLEAAGVAHDVAFETADGWKVELQRAELAFGPLYLCPGTQAGSHCETARMEWLDSVIVDTLDPTPRSIGTLSGMTGSVYSWMYDLGIVSLLTQSSPLVLPAAKSLEGYSAIIAGVANKDDISLPFAARVIVRQAQESQQGISAVRKSTTDPFDHTITGEERALVVTFDPATWIRTVQFDAYVHHDTCTPDGPTIVCDEPNAYHCSADGTVLESEDCGRKNKVCQPDAGCIDEIDISTDSTNYRAIQQALTLQGRAQFHWH